MATYKETVGTAVVNYAGDLPSALEGQVWYDSTNVDFKYQYVNKTTAGAWSTGGNLNTGRRYQGGAGTSNSSFITFGNFPRAAITELYNGASWTEVADLNEAKGLMTGTGTATAAITAGGNIAASPGKSLNTEVWNGTCWSEQNNLLAVVSRNVMAGTTTSALSSGGEVPVVGATVDTSSWNGSSWTEVNNLNTARQLNSGVGASNTNAISVGNFKPSPASPPVAAIVESWNGTSWTEVADLNTEEVIQHHQEILTQML